MFGSRSKGVDKQHPGVESIVDSQALDLPLYGDPDAIVPPLDPLWEQCTPHYAHEFLNNVGSTCPHGPRRFGLKYRQDFRFPRPNSWMKTTIRQLEAAFPLCRPATSA